VTNRTLNARWLWAAHRRRGLTDPVTVLDTRVVSGSGGGPDKTILNQPRFLAGSGYRNVCAYMHPPNDPGFEQLRRKAAAWQAPLLSVPDRGPLDWRVMWRMLRLCRRERVRIWHGHDYKSNALGLLLRRFWPMRLVTTVHGWGVRGERRTPLYYRLDRLCLPHYERVLCVSPDLHRQCLAGGVPEDRCVLVENAIDVAEFTRRRTRGEAKRVLGLCPDRIWVGAVGRLSAEKGFDLLISAVDQLLGTGLDVGLVIAGDGEMRRPLEALIARLGRGDRIYLVGYRPDVRDLYEALDVFALSSLSEGLPNVVLEAMALNVPVVATRIAGIPNVIDDGVNGLVVGPGSVPDLTASLHRLAVDADLRARLAHAARRTVEARYSFAARMDRIRALYDALLDPRRPCESAR
jgi:glycosyltransferase involved in cell wall biosynthesis